MVRPVDPGRRAFPDRFALFARFRHQGWQQTYIEVVRVRKVFRRDPPGTVQKGRSRKRWSERLYHAVQGLRIFPLESCPFAPLHLKPLSPTAGLRFRFLFPRLEKGCNGIDGDWEYGGRILSTSDLDQRLQVTELQGSRVSADHIGGIGQTSRGLEFAFGVNNFRATFAFRFRLTRDGSLHFLGQVHVLNFHGVDFNPPGLSLLVNDPLKIGVDLFPLRQQVVELTLPQHAAKCRLCHHGCGIQIVFDLNDGSLLVHDSEVDDRVHLDADVVLSNDILGWYVHSYRPQADANHFVDEWDDNHDTRPGPSDNSASQTAPSKDHSAFVFAEHIKAHKEKHYSENHDCKLSDDQIHIKPLSAWKEVSHAAVSPLRV